jgi:hypothetical protein
MMTYWMTFVFEFWNNDILDRPRLTYHMFDLGHETMITPQKANQIKLWKPIPNQSNVEGQNNTKL